MMVSNSSNVVHLTTLLAWLLLGLVFAPASAHVIEFGEFRIVSRVAKAHHHNEPKEMGDKQLRKVGNAIKE